MICHGIKLLLKGNHDYWWTTLKKMNEFVDKNNLKNINFLYNNCFYYKNFDKTGDTDFFVVGTRWWDLKKQDEESLKILNREKIRLNISIKSAMDKIKQSYYKDNIKILCTTHYPPITKEMVESEEDNSFINLLKNYGIEDCIYGHLHGKSHKEGFVRKI